MGLAWFGRFAYIRMTTLPPTPEEMYARLGPLNMPPIDADDDASAELNAIIAAIPKPPPFNLPTPAGMTWKVTPAHWSNSLAINEVSSGPWAPNERNYLRACIDHMESAAVARTLDSAAGLCGEPWRIGQWFPFVSGEDSVNDFPSLGTLARLLAAHSRYSVAAKHDWSAAVDDLKTVLWLSEYASRGHFLPYRGGSGLETTALTELIHLACDEPISSAAAEDVFNTLEGLTDWRERWRDALDNQLILERVILGARYADKPNGTGWLILGGRLNETQLVARPGSPPPLQRSRLWNLLTVFYNDFATVEQKYVNLYGAVRESAFTSFASGRQVLEDLQSGPPVFNALDGYGMTSRDLNREVAVLSQIHIELFRSIALRRAAVVVVALSRYRAQRGEYPDHLADISPEVIEVIPSDPYCDCPFGYRREADDRFQLWARGDNMNDDGGRFAVDETGQPADYSEVSGERMDQVFILPRRAAYCSATLVPVTSATSASSTGAMANTSGSAP